MTSRHHSSFAGVTAMSLRPRLMPSVLALSLAGLLAGCGSLAPRTAEAPKEGEYSASVIPPFRGGGYYKDDGPGANPPANLASIPDAVPRWEPLHRFANNPYRVRGRDFEPLADARGYRARGLASWYGRKFHGRPTSIGEPYDMYAMTAAHPTLPLPSYARVTNLDNGRSIVVRLNDRGPFHPDRIIDLSYTAAYQLDILKGPTPVEVEAVFAEDAPTSFNALSAPTAPQPNDAPSVGSASTAAAAQAVVDAPAPTRPVDAPVAATFLQLGAFSSPVLAERLLDRVKVHLSRDFPAVMRLEQDGLYRVQAGPFAADADADRAAARLRDDFGVRAFKVRPATLVTAAQPAQPALFLQLAALSRAEAAEALSARFRSHYGGDMPVVAPWNDGGLFKVQVGPFLDNVQAERVAAAYQRDFGIRPFRVLR